MAYSTILPAEHTVAATRSIVSQARSGQLTLTFDISQLPSPRSWATAGGSSGYRAALVRRQLTPGLISSLPGTAGLPPSISFSTSYPELPPMPRRCKGAHLSSEGKRRTTHGQGIERNKHVTQRSKTDRRDRRNGTAGRRSCACPASQRPIQGPRFEPQSRQASP